MKVGLYHDVRTVVIVQYLVLIGQGVLTQVTFENRPFALKAYIAKTTLPCANALQFDVCACARVRKFFFLFSLVVR
jgi:hypothetical protein